MSKQQFEEDMESFRILLNNKPEEDFCGLSPNETHELLYDTFEAGSPLKINDRIADQTLDNLPFFRLTEEFLKLIQREDKIQLTPLGALPKKVLVELYNHRFIPEPTFEDGIYKLGREIDSNVLSALHYNSILTRMVRKVSGKLVLTKEGARLLLPENRNSLFVKVLRTYTEKLYWSDFDGYPSVPVGNLGWGFTIILLLKYGNEPKQIQFYAEKYIKALPHFMAHFAKRQFSSPGQDFVRCYNLRSFERFLEWWGFVKKEESKSFFDREFLKVVPTPALTTIFDISAV